MPRSSSNCVPGQLVPDDGAAGAARAECRSPRRAVFPAPRLAVDGLDVEGGDVAQFGEFAQLGLVEEVADDLVAGDLAGGRVRRRVEDNGGEAELGGLRSIMRGRAAPPPMSPDAGQRERRGLARQRQGRLLPGRWICPVEKPSHYQRTGRENADI
ncbi:MAG: hypothetical protein U5P41_11030 [Gammaproteobacteria bacterium]|nr:hypothetical protein [Gammaproteobacteria bacterium]